MAAAGNPRCEDGFRFLIPKPRFNEVSLESAIARVT